MSENSKRPGRRPSILAPLAKDYERAKARLKRAETAYVKVSAAAEELDDAREELRITSEKFNTALRDIEDE